MSYKYNMNSQELNKDFQDFVTEERDQFNEHLS